MDLFDIFCHSEISSFISGAFLPAHLSKKACNAALLFSYGPFKEPKKKTF